MDNYHARMKHIDIRYHFIWHAIISGMLNFVFCLSEDIMADILTKALSKRKVCFHNSTLGLHDSVTLEGEWQDSVPHEACITASHGPF